MALIRYKLGDLIELLVQPNVDLKYGIDNVRGVNNQKKLMPTKADLNGRDLSKFQIVNPGEFFFNHRTSRNGSKFSVTYNYESSPVICTEDYVVFKIKSDCETILIKEWLYMFFNRSEFDRFVITNSWGSSTEFYNWTDICDIELILPSITIQQKYVDIYNAMISNQECYERGLEDLKLTCDAYIENLRKKMTCEEIGFYIHQKSVRNTDRTVSKVMGLSTKKEFREPQSRVNKNELANYKIVNQNDFAFVPTTDTWKVLAFAYNNEPECIVVSPIYGVFSVDINVVIPAYLSMWLSRSEFDRYARYHSWGSARENFSFEDMCQVTIPIPSIAIQQDIVNIYNSYIERKSINERLKTQIRDICPILVKGSLEDKR